MIRNIFSKSIILFTCAAFVIFFGCSDSPTGPEKQGLIFRSVAWNDIPLSGRYLELHPWNSTFLYIESDSAIPAFPTEPGDAAWFWTGTYSTEKISDTSFSFLANVDNFSAWDYPNQYPEEFLNYVITRTLEGSITDSAGTLVRVRGEASLDMKYIGGGGSSTSMLNLYATSE